jgi:hypothetical protein
VLPRTWLAYRARVLDKEAAFAAIARSDFDPRAELVLNRDLGLVTGGLGSGTASVVAYEPDEVRIRVIPLRPAAGAGRIPREHSQPCLPTGRVWCGCTYPATVSLNETPVGVNCIRRLLHVGINAR